MQRPDQGSVDLVKAVLTAIGFQVEEIQRGSDPSPDLLAAMGSEAHVIEVKEKLSIREYEANHLDSDTVVAYNRSRSTGYSNRLAGILRKAAKQLQFDPTRLDQVFRVVWFVVTGPDGRLFQSQLLSTLYGIRRVGFRWLSGPWSHLPCYYARNSVFFTFRHVLDAVVIGDHRQGRLCLNDQSSGYESLKSSILAAGFGDSLLDPAAEEAHGHAFRILGDFPRESDAALLDYLNSSYQIKAVNLFDMDHHQVEVVVPDGSDDAPRPTDASAGTSSEQSRPVSPLPARRLAQ